ncbi:MAG: hypothetical protein LBC18_03095 [Opitutaceae bacterium]|jgi:hypothetical protein|nr:hypothetical protein [Opitutaceae bacterium]
MLIQRSTQKPKLYVWRNVRLDEETNAAVAEQAASYGVSQSDLVRFALAKGLEAFRRRGITLTPTRAPRGSRQVSGGAR